MTIARGQKKIPISSVYFNLRCSKDYYGSMRSQLFFCTEMKFWQSKERTNNNFAHPLQNLEKLAGSVWPSLSSNGDHPQSPTPCIANSASVTTTRQQWWRSWDDNNILWHISGSLLQYPFFGLPKISAILSGHKTLYEEKCWQRRHLRSHVSSILR